MSLETELEQFDTLKQELITAKTNQKNALIALGRTPSDVWSTYPEELRSVAGSSGGAVQSTKTVVPNPAGMEILPDNPYAAMLQVILQGDPNFQPWNIAAGIDIWGKTGKAKPAISTSWPDVPATEEEMDEAAQEDDPDVNTEDKMVLVDNNGNITVGYLYNEPDSGLMVYGGMVLPELPETEYPYKVIVQSKASSGGMKYNLFTREEPFTMPEGSDAVSIMAYGERYNHTDEGWQKSFGSLLSCTFVWANHDILYSDNQLHPELDLEGQLYLAASDPTPYTGFQITWYDPATTNFKAVGWRRVSKHTTGELAGQITKDDFTRTESGGWNYLKNIRSCTREALYYKGVEVWPDENAMWHTWFDGEVINGFTIDASAMDSFSMLGRKWSRVTVDGVSEILPIVSSNVSPRWIGNPYLYDQSHEDNGYNFCVYQTGTANTTICFRQGETHNIKIEGAVYLNE